VETRLLPTSDNWGGMGQGSESIYRILNVLENHSSVADQVQLCIDPLPDLDFGTLFLVVMLLVLNAQLQRKK
jgi:hypothetical protein